ncbi:MAG: Flp family type IVb pilin [Anaerolineae bacterium]
MHLKYHRPIPPTRLARRHPRLSPVLFPLTDSGQGLIEYILIIALLGAVVAASLALVGISTRNVFSAAGEGLQGEIAPDDSAPPPEAITVNVVNSEGRPIASVRVYAFNDRGRYTGKSGRTDGAGEVIFKLDEGSYKFRGDYQRKSFWSATIAWPKQGRATIKTGERSFTVHVTGATGDGIPNVRVYAFDSNKRYVGLAGRTDSGGAVLFNLADGDYMFRADYQASQYWSDVATSPNQTSAVVNTGRRPFKVMVIDAAGNGIAGVRVYAFTGGGRYTGDGQRTDSGGVGLFNLPDGDYKFRADYQANQYWSAVTTTPAATVATINTGQRSFTVRVVDSKGKPVNKARVYAFTEDDHYTGVGGRIDKQGTVTLTLAGGSYKFRVDYKKERYWSGVVTSGADTITVTVGDKDDGDKDDKD